MKSHAEFLGRGYLRRQQISGSTGMEIVVIAARGASRQRQLGQADPCRGVDSFFVEVRRPGGVQRLQPPEQRLVGHRWPCSGEVLVEVMVGVDQPRGDELIGSVDDLGGLGFRIE